MKQKGKDILSLIWLCTLMFVYDNVLAQSNTTGQDIKIGNQAKVQL